MLNKMVMLLVVSSLVATNVQAAEDQKKPAIEPHMGPVINNFGPVFDVPEEPYMLKKGVHYKTSMDISEGSEDHSKLNRQFESAARYLNMNASSGIDPADL